jgi:hypothetical protein
MSLITDYKRSDLDVEENVEMAPPAGLQTVGHHQPSGLEVRTS